MSVLFTEPNREEFRNRCAKRHLNKCIFKLFLIFMKLFNTKLIGIAENEYRIWICPCAWEMKRKRLQDHSLLSHLGRLTAIKRSREAKRKVKILHQFCSGVCKRYCQISLTNEENNQTNKKKTRTVVFNLPIFKMIFFDFSYFTAFLLETMNTIARLTWILFSCLSIIWRISKSF